MNDPPRISEAEWTVMRLLWQRAPLTANDVVAALAGETSWHPKTVRTLINRLVQKKALRFTKEGRVHHYYPSLAEADCVRAESRSFLRRVYGGALKPMLAAFLQEEKLSAEEIVELRRLLDAKEKE